MVSIHLGVSIDAGNDSSKLQFASFVFPPKTTIFEGFETNGRHHGSPVEKTIQMDQFSAQTELFSGFLDFSPRPQIVGGKNAPSSDGGII